MYSRYWNENSVVDISEILNNNIMKLNDSVSQDRQSLLNFLRKKNIT